jgi:XRE family aerobic/anaerobic benzoate catabolism transcriptional regulator
MAQGDFRPMAQNREAMGDLVAILEARRADYARAEAELDTSADAVERTFAKLLRIVTNLLGSRATPSSARPQRKGNAKNRDVVR